MAGRFGGGSLTASAFGGLLVPQPTVKPIDAAANIGADSLGFAVQESV
jgi:hypothetical protein